MLFSHDNLSQVLASLGVTDSGDIFEQLAEQYRSPSRHYHSDQHVIECLRHFEKFRHLAEHSAEIKVAIWFHDAIYDSQKSDNEEQSAAWATSYLTSKGVAEGVVSRIDAMIIATKTHKPFNHDSAIMLDIDLGILGASDAAFEAYDQAVRREYQWVPAKAYESGRKQVLASFLSRERIYHTDAMFEQYESQARRNLTRRMDR
ncbi:HD domain-containing protein [Leucothrix arctica]|uniref:N-methyl-D-aspartate receptor NMDAR2C subunit n=1 Tax=Leucothrix arctica TaxID=1481894 RepID=A0A317C6K8_9GAMM|nr:N-methyl-D-aspartate receptor NMDAR2C subunit [Leucothrix arctica]PWQ94238.1 N-methyl-D-aspartate receptor NMDAR2C subunit [Leucothrix arctica]